MTKKRKYSRFDIPHFMAAKGLRTIPQKYHGAIFMLWLWADPPEVRALNLGPGAFCVSPSRLADALGCTDRQARRLLRGLRDGGVIRPVVFSRGGRPTVHQFINQAYTFPPTD